MSLTCSSCVYVNIYMHIYTCVWEAGSCKWLDIADAFMFTCSSAISSSISSTSSSTTAASASAAVVGGGGAAGSREVAVFRDEFRLDGTHAHPRYVPLVLLPALTAELQI
jgi:hypothetical protein